MSCHNYSFEADCWNIHDLLTQIEQEIRSFLFHYCRCTSNWRSYIIQTMSIIYQLKPYELPEMTKFIICQQEMVNKFVLEFKKCRVIPNKETRKELESTWVEGIYDTPRWIYLILKRHIIKGAV